jgi:hypothetical protein
MKNTIYALLVSALAAAQATRPAAELRSSALAKQLVTLMAERGLGTVAARDPDAPDRFVAAMAFPDVQLLVVAARYPVPTLVQDQLAAKRFNRHLCGTASGANEGEQAFLPGHRL